MTQQRVLKPYVRDRMAPHTGEPWTEAMLVGLAGGIGFMYFIFEYKGLHPTMTIIARHHPEPYLPAALARAGVPFTAPQTTSAKKATAALRAALDGGATPICTVSRDSLPWHGVRGPLYSQDPHPVAVIGVEGDTVYLDDERVTPIPVAEDAFVAAWSAYRKGKHSMITVSTSTVDIAAASTVDVSDIGGAVTDAVATTCAHLTGPVLGNTFDVNFGFSGARKLAAQLRDPKGPEGWSQRYANPEAFFFALRRLHDCLEYTIGRRSSSPAVRTSPSGQPRCIGGRRRWRPSSRPLTRSTRPAVGRSSISSPTVWSPRWRWSSAPSTCLPSRLPRRRGARPPPGSGGPRPAGAAPPARGTARWRHRAAPAPARTGRCDRGA